jgi:glycosidase
MRIHTSLFVFLFTLVSCSGAERVTVSIPVDVRSTAETLWVALDAAEAPGSTVVHLDSGKRLFLAFQADCIVKIENEAVAAVQVYQDGRWQAHSAEHVQLVEAEGRLSVVLGNHDEWDRTRSVAWFKESESGEVVSPFNEQPLVASPDFYLPRFYAVDSSGDLELRGRFGKPANRPRVYQMLPRLFGNENETRKVNGTLAENGVGKFSDLSNEVLAQFKADGFSHIWLTGVLQQATSTDYTDVGQPADDPDLLKGIAGSPYAIRDYFDVCPDYADDPAKRIEEFKALTARMRAVGLSMVIDFVPNHVARSYDSDIKPEFNFGNNDRKDTYFHPSNNFFYLTSEITDGEGPLRLPTVDPKTGEVVNETARLVGRADGLFAPEREHGRVTGNNVASWTPSNGDWYETVKLNYGYDFLNRDRAPEYPTAIDPNKAIPDTWEKMDEVLAYWQSLGVDGFRVDMAHMVPPEFWKWVIHRAKARQPEIFFFAEAYNDDPAKVPSYDPSIGKDENVMVALLDAGFDAVYDDPGYDTLEHMYNGIAWANDLEGIEKGLGGFFFDCALRYAENHDEIRLANPNTWGGLGADVGRPVTGTLYGLSRGPVMLYHGQEVGEPGLGREGFGGDDSRSSIFDYWSLPELNKWWNDGAADGGRLSAEQTALRAWYVRLLQLQTGAAFTSGETIFLNSLNVENPDYGRVEAGITASGKWFFAYLRTDAATDSHYLITTNFHADSVMEDVRIRLPESAVTALGLEDQPSGARLVLMDRLSDGERRTITMSVSEAVEQGIHIDQVDALNVHYWEIRIESSDSQHAVILNKETF